MPFISLAKAARGGFQPFLSTGWAFACRLETVTMAPITAIITLPLFLYLLVRRGYYEMLFSSQKKT